MMDNNNQANDYDDEQESVTDSDGFERVENENDDDGVGSVAVVENGQENEGQQAKANAGQNGQQQREQWPQEEDMETASGISSEEDVGEEKVKEDEMPELPEGNGNSGGGVGIGLWDGNGQLNYTGATSLSTETEQPSITELTEHLQAKIALLELDLSNVAANASSELNRIARDVYMKMHMLESQISALKDEQHKLAATTTTAKPAFAASPYRSREELDQFIQQLITHKVAAVEEREMATFKEELGAKFVVESNKLRKELADHCAELLLAGNGKKEGGMREKQNSTFTKATIEDGSDDKSSNDDVRTGELERQLKAKDKLVGRANHEINALLAQFNELRKHSNSPNIWIAKLPAGCRWSAQRGSKNIDILDSGLKAVSRKYDAGFYSPMFPAAPFDQVAARILQRAGFNTVYYFELKIRCMSKSSKLSDVYIGFAAKCSVSTRYIEFCSNGLVKCRTSKEWEKYGTDFKAGDVIGCGLVVLPPSEKNADGTAKKAHGFLTVNGTAAKHVQLDVVDVPVWPFAGLGSEGAMVEVNFGQNPGKPYKYCVWDHQMP